MELLQPSISRSGHMRVTVCAEGNSHVQSRKMNRPTGDKKIAL